MQSLCGPTDSKHLVFDLNNIKQLKTIFRIILLYFMVPILFCDSEHLPQQV